MSVFAQKREIANKVNENEEKYNSFFKLVAAVFLTTFAVNNVPTVEGEKNDKKSGHFDG